MGAGAAVAVPYRLRYQITWNHGLSRAVLRVYTRALGAVYARGARARGIEGGQTGMVTALQRAGNACKPFAWRDQFAKTNVFNADDRKQLQEKWSELLEKMGKR